MPAQLDDLFFSPIPTAQPNSPAASAPPPAQAMTGYAGALPAPLRDLVQQALRGTGLQLADQLTAETRFALVTGDVSAADVWAGQAPGGPTLYCLPAGSETAFAIGPEQGILSCQPGAPLAACIRHSIACFDRLQQLQQQVAEAQQVAMTSMQQNAELGALLHFVEHSYECVDLAQLSNVLFTCLASLHLTATLGFFSHDQTQFFTADGVARPAAERSIRTNRTGGRIVDHGHQSHFNYSHLTALVHDMPVANPERYGVLKDHLCLLFNGAEARAAAIATAQLADRRSRRIQMTAQVIQGVLADLDEQKRHFTNRSSEIIEGLLLDLRAAMAMLDLNEREEQKLQDLVEQAGEAIATLFSDAEQRDRSFQDILSRLAALLRRE